MMLQPPILSGDKAKQIVEQARRFGHDINIRDGGRFNVDTAILTIVSDDKVSEHEVTREFLLKEGLK